MLLTKYDYYAKFKMKHLCVKKQGKRVKLNREETKINNIIRKGKFKIIIVRYMETNNKTNCKLAKTIIRVTVH